MKQLLASLAVLCSAHLYGGTPSVFDGPRFVAPHGEVRDIRVADFDNDGKRDFAVASGDSISVYRGSGDGRFALPVTMSFDLSYARFDSALLDGDAFPDLVVRAADGVRFYRGNGDGSFTSGSLLTGPGWCSDGTVTLVELTSDARPDVVVCGSLFRNLGNGNFGGAESAGLGTGYFADANGDGKQDAFLSSSDIFWNLRLGNGDGTFQPAVWVDGEGFSAAGDFNADGRADYAWVDNDRHDLAVRLRNADGSYGTRMSAGFVSEERNSTLRTADLNGDGRADIIAAAAGHVAVSLSGPDGAPGPLRTYVAAPGAFELAVADFNGDALPDLLTGGDGDAWSDFGNVTYLRGTAGGTFAAPRGVFLSSSTTAGNFYGVSPRGVAVDDVTGDAQPDVIVIASGGIHVLPGTGGASFATPINTGVSGMAFDSGVFIGTFGDYTGDGALDVILSTFGEFACYAANGDGTFRRTADLTATGSDIPPRLAGGDFDGDGTGDVVIDTGTGLELFRGRGDGTFDAPVTTALTIPYGQPPMAGDVNGDGADDLVLSETILLGSPSATFTALDYDGSYIPVSALVDLNDDGHLDVVRYDDFFHSATMSIALGNGDGSFGPLRNLQVDQHGGPHPLTRGLPGDFDADGNIDLVFGTTVLLGDGAGSFDGYARYRYATTLRNSALGDFDGNGTPDLVLVDGANHAVDLITTLTTESLDLPLSISISVAPATWRAGEAFSVTVVGEKTDAFSTSGGVVLAVGGTVVTIAELQDGTANADLKAYVPGTHSLTAVFGGDPVYAAAVAAPRTIEITRATVFGYPSHSPQNPTTLTPVLVGGVVYSLLLVKPTGELVLTVDGVERGRAPAPLFDIALGLLSAGSHTINLSYTGDSQHLPHTWNWTITVARPTATIALTITPASSAPVGTSVTLTAAFPNEPTLSGGSVTFSWNGKTVATVPVVNGSAAITTTGLEVASSYVWASYSGNDVYRSSGSTVNYTVTDIPLASAPRAFHLVMPCRILDTRGPSAPSGGPILGGSATRAIAITGSCGIPSGAAAVAMNITVVTPANVGFLTVFPGASPRPETSTLNYRTGRTRANSAIMPLSAGGRLNLFNSGPATHIVIDVTGYFQ